MSETLSTGRAMLAAALNVAPDTIPDDAAIGLLESWDSLGHMRLVLALEQQLTRELTADEISELANLADIQRLLNA